MNSIKLDEAGVERRRLKREAGARLSAEERVAIKALAGGSRQQYPPPIFTWEYFAIVCLAIAAITYGVGGLLR